MKITIKKKPPAEFYHTGQVIRLTSGLSSGRGFSSTPFSITTECRGYLLAGVKASALQLYAGHQNLKQCV